MTTTLFEKGARVLLTVGLRWARIQTVNGDGSFLVQLEWDRSYRTCRKYDFIETDDPDLKGLSSAQRWRVRSANVDVRLFAASIRVSS